MVSTRQLKAIKGSKRTHTRCYGKKDLIYKIKFNAWNFIWTHYDTGAATGDVMWKKDVLKNFAVFTGKHLC